MPDRPETVFPDIGLGVLSWKGYETLENSLNSYAERNFLSLFGEARVFLPEADETGRDVARRFGLEISESASNLGILGGFEALASCLGKPYILLLENDWTLVETREEAIAQIGEALGYIKEGRAQLAVFRDSETQGLQSPGLSKGMRYFPPDDAPATKQALAAIRRLLRPRKAKRLAGRTVYYLRNAEKRFPAHIERPAGSRMQLVDSRIINWTNPCVLIERAFFLDNIIGYAKNAPTTRRVNGFRNLEIEMNSDYWHRSGWKVCVAPGLFTHKRLAYRGY